MSHYRDRVLPAGLHEIALQAYCSRSMDAAVAPAFLVRHLPDEHHVLTEDVPVRTFARN